MKKWKSMVGATVGGLMIVLTGCQSVGGLDINKALTNQAAVKSEESSGSIGLEFVLNKGAAADVQSDEATKLLQLFNKVSINFTEVKQQDEQNQSIKGEFVYTKGKIPFEISVSPEQVVFNVEGAQKPFVLAMNGTVENDAMVEQMQKAVPELIKFIVKQLPNPSKIDVKSENITVHNESVSTQKLHAEIYGNEILPLVKTFLSNLVADEQGMKDLISTLYDPLKPIIKQIILANPDIELNEALIDTYLNNKELSVGLASNYLKTQLKELLDGYDDAVKELSSDADFKTVFSDKTYLKTDYYFDSNLLTRKSAVDAVIAMPGDSPISAIKLTGNFENWNINQTVKANAISTANGKIELDNSESMMTPGRLLKNLDKQSQFYTLLKNDLQITKKNIVLDVGTDGKPEGTTPYIVDGTTLVPVRFVAEQLDADVKWNGEKKQITITDDLTDRVTVITIDSKTATVNGKSYDLAVPASISPEGISFIPLRFIVEQSLSAKISWNNEDRLITIDRD